MTPSASHTPTPVPGSATFEGWSDAGAWTVLLPSPAEVRQLEWADAERWPELVAELPSAVPWDVPDQAPFAGGWVGFISYDASSIAAGGRLWDERVPEPPVFFARHDTGILIDPSGQQYTFGERDPELLPPDPGASGNGANVADSMRDSWTAAVEDIRAQIAAGDVYQVNLTRRFRVGGVFDPIAVYRTLIGDDPPLCSALLHGSGWSIASASPEVLLDHDRVTGIAESRPIKGTIRNGSDESDAARRLLASEKDASEHLMILDLVRNDLGTIARPGSVHVPHPRATRRVGNILHLESTIRADVGAASVADVLAALLPAGSITGAPKRRAVAAIRSLEPVPRGVYTGAIGWIDNRGRSRFSVAIRTAVVAPDHVRYHAGGGIVWDSDPSMEEAESRLKAERFLRWSGAW